MAYGIHEAPGNPDHVYFCASRSYSAASPGEAVGLYRLALGDRSIWPSCVLELPATNLANERPVVYADGNPKAPELRPDASGVARRTLVVCDNLEVTEDGRRIYFSEPFDYTGASVDDAVDEAIALAPNGRLWRHNLDTGTTRLVAEGFHFINGVLYDLHPGPAAGGLRSGDPDVAFPSDAVQPPVGRKRQLRGGPRRHYRHERWHGPRRGGAYLARAFH